MKQSLPFTVLLGVLFAVTELPRGCLMAGELPGAVGEIPVPGATPPFPRADRSVVEAAIHDARRRFGERRELIYELIQAGLGPGVSEAALEYFQDNYVSLLGALAPDVNVLDGRYSDHFLAQENRSVRQTLEADPTCAALVVEVRLGEFAIFLGRPFFEINPRKQAEVLLHELLHMLGTGFFDSTFSVFLQKRGCYDPALSDSWNLQLFFEGKCRSSTLLPTPGASILRRSQHADAGSPFHRKGHRCSD